MRWLALLLPSACAGPDESSSPDDSSARDSGDEASLDLDLETCTLEPCGGDVVGSWVVLPTEGCSDSTATICADNPPPEDHGSSFSEVLTFADDGTYTDVFEATYDMSWFDTPSCLDELSVGDCDELEAFYGSSAELTVTCVGDAKSGCSCDRVGSWSYTGSGSYETEGTALLGDDWDYFEDPGAVQEPSTRYCATDDRLATDQHPFAGSDLHAIHVYARQ